MEASAAGAASQAGSCFAVSDGTDVMLSKRVWFRLTAETNLAVSRWKRLFSCQKIIVHAHANNSYNSGAEEELSQHHVILTPCLTTNMSRVGTV